MVDIEDSKSIYWSGVFSPLVSRPRLHKNKMLPERLDKLFGALKVGKGSGYVFGLKH